MGTLLLRVEERLQITGRGLVLLPEIPRALLGSVKHWDIVSIILRYPDGSTREASARVALEFFFPQGGKWMCYPQGLSKEEIPIGTEVWLTSENETHA